MIDQLSYNRFKKSIYAWFFPFVLVVPILVDLAGGYMYFQYQMSSSFGFAYRGLLVSIIGIYIFFIRERLIQVYFLSLVILWLAFSPLYAGFAEEWFLFYELRQLFKILFPYFMLGYFLYAIRKYAIPIEIFMRYATIYAFIAAAIILFSFVTGTGVEAYGGRTYGAQSYFKAQNDVGLSILVAFPMSFYLLYRKFSISQFIITLTIGGGLLALSTRAGILGGFGVVVAFLGALAIFGKKELRIGFAMRAVILLVSLIILAVALYFYIDFIFDNTYLLAKFVEFFQGETRPELTEAAKIRIANRGWFFNIFGEGIVSFYMHVASYFVTDMAGGIEAKSVEVDQYDIIGSYGFIFGTMIMAFPVYTFIKSIWLLIRDFTLLHFTMFLSMFLFIFHSFTAGHAIMGATVATTISIAYLYYVRYDYFDRLSESVKR